MNGSVAVMQEYLISHDLAGQRLDRFLRGQSADRSRAFLQKVIHDGCVLVNGCVCKASHTVRAGDKVTVLIPDVRPLDAQPEDIPLDVLYEDADLIVVNKAAGIVVHPAAGNAEHTLVNALLHHCRGNLAGIGGVQRPGIVHRLDKTTSGCIVVAKSDFAHQSLVSQFKTRDVRKTYRAICWGRFARKSGTIETMIGRSTQDRKKMSARVTRGRPALTEFRVHKQLDEVALVELVIHTGRTHQIRVHMAHIGHPICGDRVYGRARATGISFARPMLHAYKLGFTHPRINKRLEFVAPMPDDMSHLWKD